MRPLSLLLPLALLAGCAATPAASSHPETPMPPPTTTTPPATPPPPAARTLVLGVGEAATLDDGSRLTYLRLVNDSRCPLDVQCVWAGDAEIALQWRAADGTTRALRLHTNGQAGPSATRAGDRTVTLTALERGDAPTATLRIDRVD